MKGMEVKKYCMAAAVVKENDPKTLHILRKTDIMNENGMEQKVLKYDKSAYSYQCVSSWEDT